MAAGWSPRSGCPTARCSQGWSCLQMLCHQPRGLQYYSFWHERIYHRPYGPGVWQQEWTVAGIHRHQLGTWRNSFGRVMLLELNFCCCFWRNSLQILTLFQACAPRYIYYIFMNRRDPVGVCHIAKNNFKEFRQFRPCVESGNFASVNLICCVGRPAPRDISGFQEI